MPNHWLLPFSKTEFGSVVKDSEMKKKKKDYGHDGYFLYQRWLQRVLICLSAHVVVSVVYKVLTKYKCLFLVSCRAPSMF